jgi:hypothetical protein
VLNEITDAHCLERDSQRIGLFGTKPHCQLGRSRSTARASSHRTASASHWHGSDVSVLRHHGPTTC